MGHSNLANCESSPKAAESAKISLPSLAETSGRWRRPKHWEASRSWTSGRAATLKFEPGLKHQAETRAGSLTARSCLRRRTTWLQSARTSTTSYRLKDFECFKPQLDQWVVYFTMIDTCNSVLNRGFPQFCAKVLVPPVKRRSVKSVRTYIFYTNTLLHIFKTRLLIICCICCEFSQENNGKLC